MRNEEERQSRKERQLEKRNIERVKRIKQKKKNREYRLVSYAFIAIFAAMIAYLVYFNCLKSETFINSPYNTRQDTFSDRVIRGSILSSDGEVLAQTNVYDDGSEERVYPYSNIFAHVVGYDSNGKSGLESEANFTLLTSHQFFIDQLKNQFKGNKNQGDSVISTLNAALQETAYNALGSYWGAIVCIEPSTGKILSMVSKPDFDPNYIDDNWDSIVNDASNSCLLNRVTNGQYPPGSTFKVVTALDYYRTNGSLNGFSYCCEGSVTVDDHTITCYNSTVHGQEDLTTAFAKSCNCAFAEIGLSLGGASLKSTAQDLLFNKDLPYSSARMSSFTLNGSSSTAEIMQTAIGQGNTLVSPLHMALITCAIANGGDLMTPYLVDKVVNADGTVVRTTKPTSYKRLMSTAESVVLAGLMDQVVANGTASALYGRGYSAAGKTGSAEYDENGSSHSWFIGYSTDLDMAVAIIVEGGGTGSEVAVPIAGTLFDTYYYSKM